MDAIFQIESLDNFENVSQELLTSLYYSRKAHNTQLETLNFEKAKQEMRTTISDCNFDMQKVADAFQNKEWNEEKTKCFQNLVKQNSSELLSAALNYYNSSYGETVIDFDWVVKYVLGTSELKTLKYPLFQLILSTVNRIGQQNRVMYEINKDMILNMIKVLENI